MRVLSIPGPRSSMQYLRLFCAGLKEAGARVLDARDRDARMWRFDVLHLHFPTYYITESNLAVALIWAAACRALLLLCRLFGKRVVYTIHDVAPFRVRRAWLLWPFVDAVHRATDGFVFLSPSSQRAFQARFPNERGKPALRASIGAFPAEILSPEARLRARRRLVGDDPALLVGFLGFHRPRKGLDFAACLPAALPDGRPVRAVVAGGIEPGYRAEAEQILARIPPELLLHLDQDLSDSEIGILIQAVDVVALPYATGWNSAMAMLVLSHRQRLLASDLPVFVDFESALGAPWVMTFDRRRPLETLPLVPVDAAAEEKLTSFLAAHSFAEGARSLLAFYGGLPRAGLVQPPQVARRSRRAER